MKIENSLPITIIFLMLYSLPFISLIGAEEDISESFTSQGSLLYGKGDLQGALSNFSRALMLDSTNYKALKGLTNLSEHNELSGAIRLNLYLLQDQLEFNKILKDKVDYYENQREILLDALTAKGVDRALLLRKISSKASHQSRINKAHESSLEQKKKTGKDPLEMITGSIDEENQQLLHRVSQLKQEYYYLHSINKKRSYSRQELDQISRSFYEKLPLFYSMASAVNAPQTLSIGEIDGTDVDRDEVMAIFGQKLEEIFFDNSPLLTSLLDPFFQPFFE